MFRSCILFLLMIEFASKNVLFFFFFNRITITKKLQDQGFSFQFYMKLHEGSGLSGGSAVKNPPAFTGLIPGLEDPLEKEMAALSSILAWGIPWTEEPGGYSPWGRRVGQD